MKEVRINFANSTRDPPKKIQKARCYPNLLLESPFGSCKSISEKYYIFRKYYFPERKIFSCVWLHFKKCFGKYFLVFGCVLENTIENTFSTCYSHFLTFSRLSNEYIISFIPQYRNITKPRKKIIKSGHIFSVAKQQKHKQTQKQKYSSQIQKHKHFLGLMRGCNRAKHRADCDRREGEIAIDTVLHAIEIDGSRVCNRRFAPSQSTRRQDRDRLGASRNLGKRSRRSKLWTISASSAFLVARSKLWTISLFSWLSSFFLWLSLSFTRGRKRFEGKMNL